MKRLLTAVVAAGAAALVPPVAAATQSHSPRAELTHFVCRKDKVAAQRELAITAVMRPLTGTQHMAIKFSLLRRTPSSHSFSQLTSGDLGRWISPPDPTLGQRPGDVWSLDKAVSDLPGPAAYRLRVEFRWTGAHRRVLGRATRHTAVCRESQ